MNNKKRLLMCIPEVPYPVRRNGISIRYLPMLEHFSKDYDIDLMLILKESVIEEDLNELKKCTDNLYCKVLKNSRPGIIKKIMAHLAVLVPGKAPLEIYSYNANEIKEFIVSKTNNTHYDVKLSVTLAHAEYIQKYVNADRYVIDCIDSIYSHLHRSYKKSLINNYKLSLVRHWELKCLSKADSVSYVSPMDIDVLVNNGPELKNVHVIPNGIYVDDYIEDKEQMDGFVIGFLGNMDYYPNIQAALKMADIVESLRKENIDIKLLIIGRNPSQDIINLKDKPGVTVTGSVESIWPYVNVTDVFAFPMSYGSGQQNKLLDVMYAGRPVISSSLGNSGIGARNEYELEIADSDEELKVKIMALYADIDKRSALAKQGKKFIENKYEWSSIFNKMKSEYFNDE